MEFGGGQIIGGWSSRSKILVGFQNKVQSLVRLSLGSICVEQPLALYMSIIEFERSHLLPNTVRHFPNTFSAPPVIIHQAPADGPAVSLVSRSEGPTIQ